jgi:hypothetical protein
MGYLSILWLPVLGAMLLPALAKAKDRAQRVNCVVQMKVVDQALAQYANEHNDSYPPNLLVLSNKLSAPKFLVCPGDTTRRRRDSWNDVIISGSSYVVYAIPTGGTGSPQQPVLRCPIHGNVALADGSVHQDTRNQRSGQ